MTALGEADPVVRMVRPMLAHIHKWYDAAPSRYETA